MGVGFIRHLPEACLCAYICTPLRSYLRVHAYLRLAERSLPTLPVTPLSSHTSHLLLGSVCLLSASPSPLVPQAEGRGNLFYPSSVCTPGSFSHSLLTVSDAACLSASGQSNVCTLPSLNAPACCLKALSVNIQGT